ncbi:nitroreductase family protein [Oleidesulfovibrio sp.]|uniref:nitroreductase family protein n=1 Tax=Oleidesulfovibrio sp. TaxID=2909707 RepID=UPI003A8C6A1C
MTILSVDQNLCIGCEECVRDCRMNIIRMEQEVPAIAARREKYCIKCFHCLAVCKPGALSIHGVSPEQCTPVKGRFPALDAMEILVKGRRSVRSFSQKQVDKDLIHRLIHAASHAPTGKNNRGLLFTVVDDADTMRTLRTEVMEGIRETLRQGSSHPEAAFFEAALARWDDGQDIIFRGAPHLLWVTAPATNTTAHVDPYIALSTFELLANSAGLGTLWCGFAKWAMADMVPQVAKRMNIPEDHHTGYVMMFGKPAIRFHRTVEHGPATINSVRL